jgi:hypothetical protein
LIAGLSLRGRQFSPLCIVLSLWPCVRVLAAAHSGSGRQSGLVSSVTLVVVPNGVSTRSGRRESHGPFGLVRNLILIFRVLAYPRSCDSK